MTAIATKPAESDRDDRDRVEVTFKPGLPGFLALCERIGFPIEPFQRRIARAFFAGPSELLVLLPRGNGKSRLIATLALHHLLVTDHPAVYVAASSREQARIVYEYARDAAQALDVEDLVVRHLELRVPGGYLRVLASDAPKIHGLTPSLFVIDELQAAKDDSVYLAARTALQKRPGAKMITISTAGTGAESPLGKLRRRALAADDVRVRGALTDARSPSLRMLEWAVDPERGLGARLAKQANPASWQTLAGLREQREALPELAYRRFHLNQWVARMGSWLPAGAWQACANGGVEIEEGARIWAGIDIGGARADTAIVWIDESFNVGCEIWSGDDALMDATDFLPELAQRYRVVEVAYDPWRAQTLAKIAEAHRIKCTAFPQSDARMVPASRALHQAVVEGKIHHPDDPKLNQHVAAAVARHGRRGWRVDQAERGENIDGVVALIMAFEAATAPEPPPTRVLGWL